MALERRKKLLSSVNFVLLPCAEIYIRHLACQEVGFASARTFVVGSVALVMTDFDADAFLNSQHAQGISLVPDVREVLSHDWRFVTVGTYVLAA